MHIMVVKPLDLIKGILISSKTWNVSKSMNRKLMLEHAEDIPNQCPKNVHQHHRQCFSMIPPKPSQDVCLVLHEGYRGGISFAMECQECTSSSPPLILPSCQPTT